MKKILSIILSVSILITGCFAGTQLVVAEPVAKLSVSSASGKRGDEVTVSVIITKNSQMKSTTFSLGYNQKVLELKEAKAGKVAENTQTVVSDNSLGKITYSLVSSNAAITAAGSILDVTFIIKDSAAYGNTNITLNLSEISDGDFQPIETEVLNGQVNVIAPKLSAPENLIISEVYSNAVAVEWDEVDGATGYNIYLND